MNSFVQLSESRDLYSFYTIWVVRRKFKLRIIEVDNKSIIKWTGRRNRVLVNDQIKTPLLEESDTWQVSRNKRCLLRWTSNNHYIYEIYCTHLLYSLMKCYAILIRIDSHHIQTKYRHHFRWKKNSKWTNKFTWTSTTELWTSFHLHDVKKKKTF